MTETSSDPAADPASDDDPRQGMLDMVEVLRQRVLAGQITSIWAVSISSVEGSREWGYAAAQHDPERIIGAIHLCTRVFEARMNDSAVTLVVDSAADSEQGREN